MSESILWELFVQSGPVVSVNMPKDRVTNSHQGYVIMIIRDRTGILFSGFSGTGPNRDSGFCIPGDPVSKKFEEKSCPENPG